MARSRGVADLALEFSNIITSGASLESARKLDSLVDTDIFRQALEDQEKTNEFVDLVSGNLKKIGPAIYTFLNQLLGLELQQREPKNKMAATQARQELYWILACMTAESETTRKGLTFASIPALIGKDIGQLQVIYQADEVANEILSHALTIIINCTSTHALRPALKEQVLTPVMTYIDPEVNHVTMVIKAMCIIQYIDPDNALYEHYYSEEFFVTLTDLLSRIFFSKVYKSYHVYYERSQTGTCTNVVNLIICLQALAKASHYKCRLWKILIANRQNTDLLLAAPNKTQARKTKKLLKTLCVHSCTSCMGGASDFILKHNIEVDINVVICLEDRVNIVKEAHQLCAVVSYLQLNMDSVEHLLTAGNLVEESVCRSLLQAVVTHKCSKCHPNPQWSEFLKRNGIKSTEAKPDRSTWRVTTAAQSVSDGPPSGNCSHYAACKRFLDSLEISDQYIINKHNWCFCKTCSPQQDAKSGIHGDPPKSYSMPLGWSKFAIRAPVRATVIDVWKKWHVAFHGTSGDNVKKILKTGDFLKAGDRTPSGKVLSPPKGHFNENWKPKHFNISQFFLSPSITYASLDTFAVKKQFTDPHTNKTQFGRVVLQARVAPGSYQVGQETVGARGHQIDPLFPNSDLEWSTDHRGVIIITAILIKLKEETPEKETSLTDSNDNVIKDNPESPPGKRKKDKKGCCVQ